MFNADEIFAMGIQIEKNGKAFYLEAAKAASDEDVVKLFTRLAEWEDSHIGLFEKMRSELPEKIRKTPLFSPSDEYNSYLQAAADSHIFVRSSDISQLVSQCKSSVEALDMAITFEKDSVVFYTTAKNAMSPHLGQDRIDVLIDEELSHIALLDRMKKDTK